MIPTAKTLLLRLEEELQNNGVSKKAVRLFRKIIYNHFKKHGRNLPWRMTDNPYHILVSEIMLQQTQAPRVIGKYEEFIKTFPDFPSLHRAPLQKILRVWQGLGYNRRALSLKKIAGIVLKTYKGTLPSTIDELSSLPGIGKTTASEIAAFAFNQPTVFIETNIRTVFIHFFFHNKTNIKDSEILPLIEKTLDSSNPRLWYYALMDYGVTLKKQYSNPGRKSAHYQKQTPFKNSNRQLRGLILKVVIEKQKISESELIKKIKTEPARIKQMLLELQKDGLIKKNGQTISIA